MYRITKTALGDFYCECSIQDGTERWREANLDSAIDSMKRSAQILNHDKIKRKDIEFMQEQLRSVVVYDIVPWYTR